MQKSMEYNNKMLVSLITIASALILIILQIFFEKNSDTLGLSNVGDKVVWLSEVIVNIVIPLIIIVVVLLKKLLICVMALAFRSFASCIMVVIYTVENHQINNMETVAIIMNIIYTVVLILICLTKIYGRGVTVLVINTRMVCSIFNGSVSNLLYGLENGSTYLLYNLTYLIVSELIFILPVIHYNSIKAENNKVKRQNDISSFI